MMRMKSGTGKKAKPREIYFYNMVQFDPSSSNTRNIRRVPEPTKYFKIRRRLVATARAFMSGDETWWKPKSKEFFEERRDFNHEIEEDCIYRVGSVYFAIVDSWAFATLSMLMIIFNSFYIWADADYNTGSTYVDTAWVFIIFDQLFAIWFTAEALCRWMAFVTWKRALADTWFVLDVVLVAMMICETWVLNAVVYWIVGKNNAAQLNNFSALRALRLLRLARIVRLFRIFPQLFVLLKGMYFAMKSLIYTLMLLFVLTFICAVIFKNFSELNEGLIELKYDTVVGSFWNLLIYGTFLDSIGEMLFSLKDLHSGYAICLIAYIFMSNLTMLNMLIGVLCEVIARVTEDEKNASARAELESSITDILECYDVEDDRHLKKREFHAMMGNPDLKLILASHDIDHADLLKLEDVLFHKDASEDGSTEQISFGKFLEKVLQLRGGNAATVGDVVELRGFLNAKLLQLEAECKKATQTAAPTASTCEMLPARTTATAAAPMDDGPLLPGQVRSSPTVAFDDSPCSKSGGGPSPALSTRGADAQAHARGGVTFQEAVLAQLAEIRAHQDALQNDVLNLTTRLQELEAGPSPTTEV
mmetsp:Transcript_74532/g.216180  ORF Transcript_74532/g.216180 Transcript_74532/m.216180 type:complete len:589 (+) Transcript_74532:2-1768(+)